MGCNMCVVKRPEEQYRIMFQVRKFVSLLIKRSSSSFAVIDNLTGPSLSFSPSVHCFKTLHLVGTTKVRTDEHVEQSYRFDAG